MCCQNQVDPYCCHWLSAVVLLDFTFFFFFFDRCIVTYVKGERPYEIHMYSSESETLYSPKTANVQDVVWTYQQLTQLHSKTDTQDAWLNGQRKNPGATLF